MAKKVKIGEVPVADTRYQNSVQDQHNRVEAELAQANADAQPTPAAIAQAEGAQMLQDRINTGNMQGTTGTQAQGTQAQGTQAPEKTDQEKFFETMQNQFGTNNGHQGTAPAETKVEDPAATTKKNSYLYDWASGMSMADAYKQGKHNRGDIMRDRERWGRENNNPVNILEATDMVPENHDPRKTYQENELEEKRRKRQENWEKIGNFLSHLGNFVGAAGWGGSVQGLEQPKELTARQKAIRDKTEALRTAYNKSYFENYYKQRAAEQNAAQRQAQNELALEKLKNQQRQLDINQFRAEMEAEYKKADTERKNEMLNIQSQLAQGRIDLYEAQKQLANIRARSGGYAPKQSKDKVVEKVEETPFGKKTTTTSTKYGTSSTKKTRKSAFR